MDVIKITELGQTAKEPLLLVSSLVMFNAHLLAEEKESGKVHETTVFKHYCGMPVKYNPALPRNHYAVMDGDQIIHMGKILPRAKPDAVPMSDAILLQHIEKLETAIAEGPDVEGHKAIVVKTLKEILEGRKAVKDYETMRKEIEL